MPDYWVVAIDREEKERFDSAAEAEAALPKYPGGEIHPHYKGPGEWRSAQAKANKAVNS